MAFSGRAYLDDRSDNDENAARLGYEPENAHDVLHYPQDIAGAHVLVHDIHLACNELQFQIFKYQKTLLEMMQAGNLVDLRAFQVLLDMKSNMSLANNPALQLQEETSLSSFTGLENAEKLAKIAAVVQPSQSMLLNPAFLALAILGKVVASTAVYCRLRLINRSSEGETGQNHLIGASNVSGLKRARTSEFCFFVCRKTAKLKSAHDRGRIRFLRHNKKL
jgi:hypothetical protein